MARPTDPSFGAGFDADAFRSAIQSTMEMGMATDESQRVTFHWKIRREYATADNAGNPYDWKPPAPDPVEPVKEPVQVPCAVEFVARNAQGLHTPFGQIDTPKVILTILDEFYTEVEGASWVTINDTKYNIDYVAPPTGLFDVTVYSLYLSAQDEA
jgi:hypothetical protein